MTNKFYSLRSLSIGNGSGLDRRRIGDGSVRSYKFFTLLIVLFLSIGQMWGASATWALVTSEPSDWSGEYLIVYNSNCFDGSLTSTSLNGNAGQSASASNNKITKDDQYSLTVSKASGKYYLQTASGYYIGRKANSNGVDANTSKSNDYVVTFTWNSTNKTVKIAGTGGRCLGNNSGSWKFFSSSNAYVNVSLYKKEASSKTLSSISVQTAPTKKKYVAGEMFDPTGLVITRTYSDKTNDTYTYAGHTSDFTFSPTTSTALTTSNTSVSITYGGKSTSQAINVYNVTMQARDEDGNTIPAGGPEAPSRTGKSISPANDANNFIFKQWQVTNASLGSSENTKSNTITNPTGAVTVTAVYYKPITITYKANGQNFTTQTYGHGGTLAFPASGPNGDTYSCTGKTFTGWVAETNKDYSHASTAPTYATAGGSVTTAATYYAVFANANPSTDYKQITKEADLTAGAKYLIVGYSSSTYKALPVDAATSLTTVSVSSSTISNPGSTLIWTLEGSADAWKIKSTSNNKYLQISGGSLTFETSTSLTFSVGVSSSVFTFTSSASSGNKVLSYYASQNKFNAFSNPNTVYVYKQKITYSNYETNCCTPLGSINGSVYVTHFWDHFGPFLANPVCVLSV